MNRVTVFFVAAASAAAILLSPSVALPWADGAVLLADANVVDVKSGQVLVGAAILVRDGKIVAIGASDQERAAIEAQAGDDVVVIDVGGRYVLPGMIDAHVHVSDFASASRALHSGVTTARSMGTSYFADVGLRELAATGAIEAPRIIAAGYHVRPRPADAFFVDFPELADLLASGVQGPEAIRRMGEALVAAGVDFVKVNATERAGLPQTDPRKPFYDEGELHALVEVAGSAGVPVAAHAHGDTGGQAAVLAGVKSIEHGTYLSEKTLRLMAERDTFLVPTIAVVADLTVPGGDYDNPVLEIRGRHMLPRIRRTAARAHRLGVRLVAATDTGYGPASVLRLQDELIELVGIGLTPLEALQAATITAAELLGVADSCGRLHPGYDADLIAVEDNPLEDIGAMQDILLVINDGRVVVNRLDF